MGATLGTLNLLRLTGPFGALPRPSVWAHGYAQVFGFLALFVMGFAYHAVPRFAAAPLRAPWLVPASFVLQLAGTLGVAASFLLPHAVIPTLWRFGTAALVGGSLCFLGVIALTLRGNPGSAAFGRWMVAGTSGS